VRHARKPTILVIGDVMLDIIAAPERAMELGTDTPATISLLPGGSGANAAAWLGEFGNDVRFAGRVGPDGAPEHAAALRAHGVEPLFARDERVRTGVLVTLVGAAGERSFLTDRGANARLSRGDLPDSLLEGVDLVHVSGYAFFGAGPRAAVREFLAAVARRGVPFTVDAGSSAVLREVGPGSFLDWTSAATMCFVNAPEAAVLAGSSERTEQRKTLGASYETAIVTCGAAGAFAVTGFGTGQRSIDAADVEPLDTSGAGDAFLAGYLSAHLRGEPLERCLERGVRAGSTAVLHYGGRPVTLAAQPAALATANAGSKTTEAYDIDAR
jgi:sugar/nucleoside kinase (ribokinase family)